MNIGGNSSGGGKPFPLARDDFPYKECLGLKKIDSLKKKLDEIESMGGYSAGGGGVTPRSR